MTADSPADVRCILTILVMLNIRPVAALMGYLVQKRPGCSIQEQSRTLLLDVKSDRANAPLPGGHLKNKMTLQNHQSWCTSISANKIWIKMCTEEEWNANRKCHKCCLNQRLVIRKNVDILFWWVISKVVKKMPSTIFYVGKASLWGT